MAGSDPRFDLAQFNTAIRFAMQMGKPTNAEDQPEFRFPKTISYPPGTAVDEDGIAFDPTIARTTTQPPPVKVDCAFEFSDATPDELPVGTFRPTKVIITLLEEEYQQVADAEEVVIGGDRYYLSHEHPPLGLFDASIRQLTAYAIDEA